MTSSRALHFKTLYLGTMRRAYGTTYAHFASAIVPERDFLDCGTENGWSFDVLSRRCEDHSGPVPRCRAVQHVHAFLPDATALIVSEDQHGRRLKERSRDSESSGPGQWYQVLECSVSHAIRRSPASTAYQRELENAATSGGFRTAGAETSAGPAEGDPAPAGPQRVLILRHADPGELVYGGIAYTNSLLALLRKAFPGVGIEQRFVFKGLSPVKSVPRKTLLLLRSQWSSLPSKVEHFRRPVLARDAEKMQRFEEKYVATGSPFSRRPSPSADWAWRRIRPCMFWRPPTTASGGRFLQGGQVRQLAAAVPTEANATLFSETQAVHQLRGFIGSVLARRA